MKMNIVGQRYLERKQQAEQMAKAKRRFLARRKQTAEERAAKIAACERKQAVKRDNRWHQYIGSVLGNPCSKLID